MKNKKINEEFDMRNSHSWGTISQLEKILTGASQGEFNSQNQSNYFTKQLGNYLKKTSQIYINHPFIRDDFDRPEQSKILTWLKLGGALYKATATWMLNKEQNQAEIEELSKYDSNLEDPKVFQVLYTVAFIFSQDMIYGKFEKLDYFMERGIPLKMMSVKYKPSWTSDEPSENRSNWIYLYYIKQVEAYGGSGFATGSHPKFSGNDRVSMKSSRGKIDINKLSSFIPKEIKEEAVLDPAELLRKYMKETEPIEMLKDLKHKLYSSEYGDIILDLFTKVMQDALKYKWVPENDIKLRDIKKIEEKEKFILNNLSKYTGLMKVDLQKFIVTNYMEDKK